VQPARLKTVPPANGEGNQKAFWDEMRRIAMKGVEGPETLTNAEIRRICQLALAGMTVRERKQPS
jgi:hypothetical protein